MADEEKKTVILEIEVDSANAQQKIEALKEANKQLREDEKKLREDREKYSQSEYISQLTEIKLKYEQNSQAIKENNDIFKANAKAISAQLGSLKQLKAELRRAEIAYNDMSKAERESAEGQALNKKILGLRTDLKVVEASTGDFRRRVGDYINSIKTAFADAGGAAGKMAGGVSGLTLKMKALAAVPIIAILNGLVFVVQKVIGALKSSEGSFNRVRMAMSGLQGVGDIVTRVLQGLGKSIAWVAEKLGGLLSKLKVVDDAAKDRQKITKQQIEYEQLLIKYKKENADIDLETEKLLKQVEERTKYSGAERLKFLDEANAKLLKVTQNNVDLAKRNYEIIKQTNALTDSSYEDRLKEADAYEAMKQAEKEYYSRSKELATKRIELINQIREEQKKASAERKQQVVDETELEKRLLAEVEEIRKKGLSALKVNAQSLSETMAAAQEEFQKTAGEMAANNDEWLTELENRAKEFDAGTIENLQALVTAKLAEYSALTQGADESMAEFRSRQLDAYNEYIEAQKALTSKEVEVQKAKMDALSDMTNSLISLLDEAGENNKAAAIASKLLALSQIAVQTGVAVSEAIAAGAGVPFPGNIAAIATGVTAVLTGVANAIATVKSAKFATGGLIQGPGTGTSDSIPAMVSNGEAVMTAKAVDMFGPILSAMNVMGGGVSFSHKSSNNKFATGGVISYNTINEGREAMWMEQFARAIENMHPHVYVREIDEVRERVIVKENM